MLKTIKTSFIALIIFSMYACSQDDIDLANLDETIYVRHKKADMPAYIHGNGADKVFLIILHGGPGGDGLSYRFNTMRTEIEKNNAVVYFDQRGSGNSQGQYDEADVSLDLMAEDVLALVEMLKFKFGDDSKFFLMGHSWGGTLGPATLLKDQTGFSGWINVAGAHDPKGFYETYKTVYRQTADEQIVLGNSVSYWQSVLELVENVGERFSLDDYYKLNSEAFKAEEVLINDKFINEPIADFGPGKALNNPITFQWNKNGIGSIIDEKEELWERVSFTDRLSEITVPSLVLWGKYDLIVPSIYSQEAFDHLGAVDKEIFIFERSGHNPMASESELFADLVITFINGH